MLVKGESLAVKSYFVVGGLGFIGSAMVKAILSEERDVKVTIYDNYSSGREEHLGNYRNDSRLSIIRADTKDLDLLKASMEGTDVVYSFASNPDIAKAVTQPDIDFWEGTYIMNNVLEAMRVTGTDRLLYASGSGVYGDVGSTVTDEDFSPMLPSSTYGASKLACEALICSYCYMFGMNADVFRFANVVGENQTHGVTYDFVHRLQESPGHLRILGDGTQSKSYIYVGDVVNAVRTIERTVSGYNYYNVATLDYLTVTEIADEVVRLMGLKDVKYEFTGGSRGWKGDVPIVRLNSEKIRRTGWKNQFTSKEAIDISIKSLL